MSNKAAPAPGILATMLSLTDQRVIRRTLYGEQPGEIALALGKKANTIRWHIEKIHRVLGVHSTAELWCYCYQHRECCGFAALLPLGGGCEDEHTANVAVAMHAVNPYNESPSYRTNMRDAGRGGMLR